jgi:hypothetical protein
MNQYKYEGPVCTSMFGVERCISSKWVGSTYAVSIEKARSNMLYSYKKENGLMVNNNLYFPNKITKVS